MIFLIVERKKIQGSKKVFKFIIYTQHGPSDIIGFYINFNNKNREIILNFWKLSYWIQFSSNKISRILLSLIDSFIF